MSLLGEKLRQEREARGIPVLQVEIDTRIRTAVVEAIESGDYKNLPPEPFLRGLVRTYASYLGVNVQEMVNLLRIDLMPQPKSPSRRFAAPKPAPQFIPPVRPIEIEPPKIEDDSPSIEPLDSTPPAIESVQEFPQVIEQAATVETTQPAKPPPPLIELPPLIEDVPLAAESTPPQVETLKDAEPSPEVYGAKELSGPESLGEPATATPSPRALLEKLPIPLPLLIGIIIAGLFLCVATCGVIALTQFSGVSSFAFNQQTATPTRLPATATPTIVPGAPPTSIPILPVTAAPFATFPIVVSPTVRVTPRRTLESNAGLVLDIDATQTVTAVIGVDNALVFSGQIAEGTSRSWSARDSLYVRVENAKGAAILFNGKEVLAQNFNERNVMERRWVMNDRGTPIRSALQTPVGPTPTRQVPATPPPSGPTATSTPFN